MFIIVFSAIKFIKSSYCSHFIDIHFPWANPVLILAVIQMIDDNDVAEYVDDEVLFHVDYERFNYSDSLPSINSWMLNNNQVKDIKHEKPIPGRVEILEAEFDEHYLLKSMLKRLNDQEEKPRNEEQCFPHDVKS